ncbi:tRNA (adenosine(37)-N6)-threonylcarbamoyltransferase complex dimerization subunit type 1 TsaB [Planctomycetes bacterium K23_9]|uniref:tRNA threonylcarbamoyladenosine biosynthesis protein TsaB n=1 Tax=Stieleria marina TaxID=1930275 RepID=A0A517NTD7_9BACT|nr:tRNA threonylcarbamoyladenosine biosynthesis protein TsaB [Planctomycetes bacterium K23_9]
MKTASAGISSANPSHTLIDYDMTISDWPVPDSLAAPSVPASIDDAIQIAIETTGHSGSIAVLEGEYVHQAHQLPDGQRTAASLAPALSQQLAWCAKREKLPHFVSIASGPGSFTGLRIGITTAKTFCYARQLPLVAVDSLQAIAANLFQQNQSIEDLIVGINAFRKQTFAGHFTRSGTLPVLSDLAHQEGHGIVQVYDASEWADVQRDAGAEVRFGGEAKVFDEAYQTRFVDRETPDAIGVGLSAIRLAKRGEFCDPMALKPRYLKESSAEERLKS